MSRLQDAGLDRFLTNAVPIFQCTSPRRFAIAVCPALEQSTACAAVLCPVDGVSYNMVECPLFVFFNQTSSDADFVFSI
jgi:hypothetical protein